MKLATMAWRNLWRRKRRTFITGFSIGFGVLLATTFTGIGDYMYTNMINSSAAMGFGHVTVEARDYNQTPALDKRLRDSNRVREQLLPMPQVKDAIVRIMGQAMFASATKSVGGMFMGIDPAQESAEKNLLLRSMVEGRVFSDTRGGAVVVGDKLAQKLNLSLGKKLVYTSTDADGEIVSEIARVSGIFHTGVDEIDGAMVLLPIDRVRRMLNYEPHDATLVAITIDDQRQAAEVCDAITKVVGNAQREVLSWRETQAEMAGFITVDSSANYISQALVGLLIAAGIFNTLLMSVLERTREFGIMLAVGMSPWTLFRLVLMESFWLGLFGLVLGILLTTPWYLYLYYVGLDFSAMVDGLDYSAAGVLVDPLVRIRLFKESVFAILVGVFLLALFSGVYPAWRAGRIPPVESLRTI